MSELSETARRAAVLRALADLVKAASDTERSYAEAELLRAGARSVTATLPDGTEVATVRLAGGRPAARVVDERAFFAWVEANHPSEIVAAVSEVYRKVLLDRCTRIGSPVEPDTGEQIPGVVVEPSAAYVVTKFATGGRDAIAAAWTAGQLDGYAPGPKAVDQ